MVEAIPYEKLLENLFDGVYYVDLDKCITIWNKGAERITGYTKAEVIGKCCADNLLRHIDDEGRELCLDGCPLSAALHVGKPQEANVFLHHKLGHRVPVSVRISPVRDDDGRIIGALEIFTDNSNALQILKELEELKHDTYLDPLTSIGNRRYGKKVLATALYEWQSHGTPLGVIFLDIDHFKLFNDNYGHQTGDAVLVMVGKTIAGMLRRSDAVCRWGGEEFVVILPNITADMLKGIAERIRVFIERSFIMAGECRLAVTASLGAVLAQPDDTPETLIHRADTLMYASKAAGRNRVTIG